MTRSLLVSLAVAVALFGVLFLPDLLAGRVFAYRDVAYYHLPISRVVGAEWRAGRVPFWNPYIACGTPLAANPNNYALYPSRVLDVVLSPEAAIQVHLLGHWLVGGVAMGALASTLGLGTLAAAATSGVFLLAGPMLSLLSFANLAPFLAWIPLTALATLRLRRAPGFRSAALLGVSLAIQTTFGEPGLFLVEAAFLAAVTLADPAPAGPARSILAWGAIAGALALVVAAPALVPTLQLAARSARAGDLRAELGYSVSPFGLLELLVPQLFGSYHTLEKLTYWGELFHAGRGPFLLSISLGACAVTLGAAGIVVRGRRAAGLGAAAVLGILVSMGGYVPGVREMLFSEAGRWLRWPVKITLLPALVAALGVGLAVDALAGRAGGRRRAAVTAGVLGVAVGAAMLALARSFAPNAPADALGPTLLAPLSGQKDVPAILAEVSGRLARTGAFALAAAALAVLAATFVPKRPRLGTLLAAALALVCIAELAPPQRAVNRGTPVDVLRADTPILSEGRALALRGLRVDFPTELWEVQLGRSPGEPDEWWPRIHLDRELGNFYHPVGEGILMTFVNPDRLVSADASARSAAYPRLSPDEQRCMRRLLGIGGTVTAGPGASVAPGAIAHLTTAGWPVAIVPNGDAIPVASWLAALPESLPSPPWGGDFLRAACERVTSAEDPAAMRVPSHAAGRWTLETKAPRAGFVALTETSDPGWSAQVDGRAAGVLPYLHDFQAVAVPAGKHRVEWSYRPRGWNALVVVSLLGLAVCAAALLPRRRAADAVRA
ncbi:MAG: hypothetical protein U0167_09840 [bacterium]